MKFKKTGIRTGLFTLMILLIGSLIACQTENAPVAEDTDKNNAESQQTEIPIEDEKPIDSDEEVAVETSEVEKEEKDSVDIEGEWLASFHSKTFVTDSEGNNNSCARCHAPVNWQPSMDDLPESCFACKFELEDPPSFIAESDWSDIPCKVCHKVDKKGNVQPEFAWLEIAALDEYASVDKPTELCQKCHSPINISNHGIAQVGGDHEGYECTQCHNAHDTVASCGAVDCHEDAIESDTPILGHDEDHESVSCAACHDNLGLDVGLDDELGYWITYVPWSFETEESSESGVVPFTSHNIVLEVNCERCHFVGNPWDLSDSIDNP